MSKSRSCGIRRGRRTVCPTRRNLNLVSCETNGDRDVANNILTLTESAVQRVRHIMELRDEEPPAIGVRIGVRNAGCSGMSYSMDYATEVSAMDEVVETGGVKVMVDPAAIMFLIGTELDFKEEKLSSGFVFNNPNVTSTCGCGESFTVN
ncbi:MAG: iron-sulfur cluster assembly accessory protein [Rhodospirillaceae bacterium]|nr:iron-sulfur cluster assembly accessory protein [Rhodospirillaceae bacterium]MBT3926716.1 iron-sulfur cluster assembly accessory protein [Rhodospirillaceae bacterium]MBT4426829.1 iron-sulfur cluster assembly accessory protein [Rhodospirillaceae bacterium]MBT5038190.1 iron-sulfur cluster assembly accessory protein [Rhodospirillaceae bacterium]MBT5677273.1 iron-sulfur cluster assembly accessory protein [Rhodospirillaceae bacterium]